MKEANKMDKDEKTLIFLNERLEELKKMFRGHGVELKLNWMPGKFPVEKIGGAEYFLNGEVKDDTIFVYVTEREEAANVLMHEFIEQVLKKEFSEPYVLLTQMMSQAYEDVAYFRQEAVINVLVTLLSKATRTKKLLKLDIIRRVEDGGKTG